MIRTAGAVCVVITVEVLAGYFLWRGMTELLDLPPGVAWTVQGGLAGGSAVGARAFHRALHEDRWWGLVASAAAFAFLLLDASTVSLLLDHLVSIRVGWLGVAVLIEALVVGYLTVHTLWSRPRDLWGNVMTAPSAPQRVSCAVRCDGHIVAHFTTTADVSTEAAASHSPRTPPRRTDQGPWT